MAASSAAVLGCVPAAFMLLFTFIGLGRQVPQSVAGALQHFAAGVLLSTIATELLPEMANARGLYENLGSAIGFFLGVALLIALGMLMPSEEAKDEVSQRGGTTEIEASPQSPRYRKQSLKAAAFRCSASVDGSDVRGRNESIDLDENHPLLLKPSVKSHTKAFPTALVVAIAVDSALDGLLIGIAAAAGPSAGPMMSGSLAVEMSFLGLTLATALHGHPPSKSIPAACLGPAVLVGGATVGGLLSATLKHSPPLFAGLLGFGTSALLFMVAEELLLEAHEEGEHVWWVDLQLYVGFFASVMSTKLIPEG